MQAVLAALVRRRNAFGSQDGRKGCWGELPCDQPQIVLLNRQPYDAIAWCQRAVT